MKWGRKDYGVEEVVLELYILGYLLYKYGCWILYLWRVWK